jgi:hypothetical protein
MKAGHPGQAISMEDDPMKTLTIAAAGLAALTLAACGNNDDKAATDAAASGADASTMAPADGAMAPADGAMAPSDGAMAPSNGAMAPSSNGAMAPSSGAMTSPGVDGGVGGQSGTQGGSTTVRTPADVNDPATSAPPRQ